MNNLYNFLEKYRNKNIVLGFSGGNDSSCLAYVLKFFGFNITPIFVSTELTKKYLPIAEKNAKIIGIDLKVINLKILKIKEIRLNSRMRCYYCKREIYSNIKKIFKNCIIFDGTNYSDTFSYRPGIKALEELEIISPFKECKIHKQEIIKFLKKITQI